MTIEYLRLVPHLNTPAFSGQIVSVAREATAEGIALALQLTADDFLDVLTP